MMEPFNISSIKNIEVLEETKLHKTLRKSLKNVIKKEFVNPKFQILVSENTKASGLESGSDV